MKKHVRFSRSGILFIGTLLIAMILLLIVELTFHIDDSALLQDDTDSAYNQGWIMILEDGQTQPAEFDERSAMHNTGTLTFENQLPAMLYNDTVFALQTYGCKMRVWLDGNQVYSYGWHDKVLFGADFGNVSNLVDIPPSAAGATLRLELTSVSADRDSTYCSFFLGSRDTIIANVLLDNLLLIASGIFTLLASVTLIAMGIAFIVRKQPLGAVRLYLGIFIFLELIWSYTEVNLFQLFWANKAFTHILNYLAFMLLPAPMLLCVSELVPRFRRRYRCFTVITCLNALITFMLYIAGAIELSQSLTFTHIMMIFFSIDMLVSCFRSRHDHPVRTILFAIVIFIITAMISMIAFYSADMSNAPLLNYSFIMCLGMDIMVVLVYVSMLRTIVAGSQLAVRAVQLEQQAYTDKMTGINNRASFEMQMDALSDDAESDLAIFMIDLNNLKLINDAMGHRAGDLLICNLADCLKSAFEGVGDIYRYGGDEFVVICQNCTQVTAASARKKLLLHLDTARNRGQFVIDVAIGCALRSASSHKLMAPNTLFNLADMDMYEAKHREKAANPANSDICLPDSCSQYWINQIDAVTGILTFTAFRQRMQSLLHDSSDEEWAVINFDMNGFDSYNAIYGWDAGDKLLKFVADTALKLCCDIGFCAHGEADNFWMLVDYSDPDDVRRQIEIGATYFYEHQDAQHLFLSFGIYHIENCSLPIREMCSRANMARRSIKKRFDVLYAEYSEELHREQLERKEMINYMASAIEKSEFVPYYQPIMDVEGEKLLSAEALVRWKRADGTLTQPTKFIELFERGGILPNLDWYMLEQVCIRLRTQMDAGLKPVPISINFSRLHAFNDQCIQKICDMVDGYGVARNLISIELSESAFVENKKRMIPFINHLRAEGFHTIMDDFGLGLYSLSLLNEVRFDCVKIDRAFLGEHASSEREGILLNGIIHILNQLGIHSTAEGVESDEQRHFMRDCGCNSIQGFNLMYPLSATDFDKLTNTATDQ